MFRISDHFGFWISRLVYANITKSENLWNLKYFLSSAFWIRDTQLKSLPLLKDSQLICIHSKEKIIFVAVFAFKVKTLLPFLSDSSVLLFFFLEALSYTQCAKKKEHQRIITGAQWALEHPFYWDKVFLLFTFHFLVCSHFKTLKEV